MPVLGRPFGNNSPLLVPQPRMLIEVRVIVTWLPPSVHQKQHKSVKSHFKFKIQFRFKKVMQSEMPRHRLLSFLSSCRSAPCQGQEDTKSSLALSRTLLRTQRLAWSRKSQCMLWFNIYICSWLCLRYQRIQSCEIYKWSAFFECFVCRQSRLQEYHYCWGGWWSHS